MLFGDVSLLPQLLKVAEGLPYGVSIALHNAGGIGFVIHLVCDQIQLTLFERTVAELAVFAGLTAGEVNLIAELVDWRTFEGFYLCFSNLNDGIRTVGERLIVVVVLGDLLQVKPIVPSLLLPHTPFLPSPSACSASIRCSSNGSG